MLTLWLFAEIMCNIESVICNICVCCELGTVWSTVWSGFYNMCEMFVSLFLTMMMITSYDNSKGR